MQGIRFVRARDRSPMTLVRHAGLPPKGAVCFGCNQSFDGGAAAVKFTTDLLPPAELPELTNLYFHPGHLLRYARRRNWTALAEFIEKNGVPNF